MKFSFRPYKSDKGTSADDSSEAAANKTAKRREQIRKAQKTHRERKEAYINSLEAEVVQLKGNEARILQDAKKLHARINTLEGLLHNNGILVPPRADGFPIPSLDSPREHSSHDIEQWTLTCGVKERKGKNRRRQICIQTAPRREERQFGGAFTSPTTDATTPSLSVATSILTSTTPSPSIRLGDLDPTVLGLDFVLTLESPCLPHVEAEANSTDRDANGHALTASACLLHHHPAMADPHTQLTSAWQVPNAGIERLLELSRSIIVADDEVTPVQAWDIVRNHEQFRTLEVSRLEDLKEKLVAWVKCYGFGGVILRAVLEDAIFETFVVGRVF